jgi:rod shape-determining protein MreC
LRAAWNSYIGLRRLSSENEQLHAELDSLKLRNAQLESRAAESDRLAALMGFRERHSTVPMLAARVIGVSPDTGSRIIFLDRGSRDRVARDMGVITPDGVIGKVLAVFPETSQVLLLSDKDSGVGALIAGTRIQGPVRGTGASTLQMEYVTNEMPVSAGQAVLTSGQDQIFPKDLPVGTVLTVQPGDRGPFQQIIVRPAARLDRLEEVLVLLTRKEFALNYRTGEPLPTSTLSNPEPER